MQANEKLMKDLDFECARNDKQIFVQEQNIKGYDLDLKNTAEVLRGLLARID